MQRLLKLRKDNKGDTLLIVIVGILLLGILGSVLLSSTVLNYNMKNVNSGQKKSFYTAEEAVDAVYAGVGEDVMEAMQYSYTYVLNNMLTKNADGDYVTTNNDYLNKLFRNIFFYRLTGKECNSSDKVSDWNTVLVRANAEGSTIMTQCNERRVDPVTNQLIKYKRYANGVDEQRELEEYLQSLVGTGSDVPTVHINRAEPGVPLNAIEYGTKDVTTEKGDVVTVDYFTIKDLSVSYTSKAGITSDVTTDIVVEIPVIDINFSEVNVYNYNELFKYIIVTEGDATNRNTASLTINKNTVANGNIYAGKELSVAKTGILLNNSDLSVSATNVATSGDINVYNAEFALGRGPLGNPLKLWAKNIVTSGLHDKVNIADASVIVKDDLQIGGSGSEVKISGSYYGIGFRAADDTNTVEANSNENDSLYFDHSNGFMFDANGNNIGSITEYEHEKSSSIVVNGRDADVNLFELKTLLLGGRAYVDLIDPDAGLGEDNSTYMTGESIAVRGNQEAYLSDITDKTQFNFITSTTADDRNVVTSNPVTYDFFINNIRGKNILTDKTVAKKVGGSVYFYRKSVSPTEQTSLFENYVNDSKNKRLLREKADKLGVKAISIDETGTNLLTVGTMMKVDNTKPDSQRVLVMNHTLNDANKNLFARYISDVSLRYKAMMTELADYGNIDTTTVPSNIQASIAASTKTPISTYVDADMFQKVFLGTVPGMNMSNLTDGGETYKTSYDAILSGLDMTGYNITNNNSFVILTKKDEYVVSGNVTNGIIISSGKKVTVSGDFTGIIICAGDVVIEGGAGTVYLNAFPDLMEWLTTKDTTLSACLKGYRSSAAGEGEGSGHVTLNNIGYQDLVSYDNWKKSAVNKSVDDNPND